MDEKTGQNLISNNMATYQSIYSNPVVQTVIDMYSVTVCSNNSDSGSSDHHHHARQNPTWKFYPKGEVRILAVIDGLLVNEQLVFFLL